jgi:chromate transporter
VVGVILNLAVWFAAHVVFGTVHELRRYGLRLLVPEISTIDPFAAVVTAGALIAMLRFKVTMIPTLAVCAALGLLYGLAT